MMKSLNLLTHEILEKYESYLCITAPCMAIGIGHDLKIERQAFWDITVNGSRAHGLGIDLFAR